MQLDFEPSNSRRGSSPPFIDPTVRPEDTMRPLVPVSLPETPWVAPTDPIPPLKNLNTTHYGDDRGAAA